MVVKELIELLKLCQADADVYVVSPIGKKDYLLDSVRIESDSQSRGTEIFLETLQ